MRSYSTLRPVALALSASALLAACGGGSGTTNSPSQVVGLSDDQALAYSANSSYIPTDTVQASSEVVTATKAAVAGSQASQTYNCVGGGTAVYTVTGATIAGATNGQLDAGETYNVTFTNCKGSAGAATINGSVTAAVESASAAGVKLNMTNNGVIVTLPKRTVQLNGASTLEQSVTTSSGSAVTTNRFTAQNLSTNITFGARKSTFSLSNVDMTRAFTVSNNVVSAVTYSGTATLSATLPNGAFSVTTATQGNTNFAADGTLAQGTWVTTWPNYKITLKVANGTATIEIDQGNDGTVDRTITVPVANVESAAG